MFCLQNRFGTSVYPYNFSSECKKKQHTTKPSRHLKLLSSIILTKIWVKTGKIWGAMTADLPKDSALLWESQQLQNSVAQSPCRRARCPKYLETQGQKELVVKSIGRLRINHSPKILDTYCSLFIPQIKPYGSPESHQTCSRSKTLSQRLVNVLDRFTAKRNLQNNCLISPNSPHMISSWVVCEAATSGEHLQALML